MASAPVAVHDAGSARGGRTQTGRSSLIPVSWPQWPYNGEGIPSNCLSVVQLMNRLAWAPAALRANWLFRMFSIRRRLQIYGPGLWRRGCCAGRPLYMNAGELGVRWPLAPRQGEQVTGCGNLQFWLAENPEPSYGERSPVHLLEALTPASTEPHLVICN